MRYVLIGAAVLLLLFGAWTAYQNANCGITEYTVSCSRLPDAFDGYRVLQISDFHSACFGHDNEQLIEDARQAKPDVILVTGDFADSRSTDFTRCVSFAKRLREIAPVYCVTGNHESFFDKEERDRLYAELAEVGAIRVNNETVLLERGGEHITLIGLKDITFYKKKNRDDMKAELASLVPEDGFSLLMTHRPDFFDIYAACGVDLALTGHAHGGQIRLPLIGGIYASGQGWFPKYTDGLQRQGETQMIISRGIGNSRFPLRINNPPEMVLAVLRTEN